MSLERFRSPSLKDKIEGRGPEGAGRSGGVRESPIEILTETPAETPTETPTETSAEMNVETVLPEVQKLKGRKIKKQRTKRKTKK